MKWKLKEKLKNYYSNNSKPVKPMKELTDSIKRPNLRIISIEEGEEVQVKGICNIFNKIIAENFPNLEITMPIQTQEASSTPNRMTPWHIIIKTTSTQNKKRILKAVREKKQTPYKGKPIKITAYFTMETLKARRAWSEVFWALNENNFTLGYSTQQNYHSKQMR
jgi:hypothetical protein